MIYMFGFVRTRGRFRAMLDAYSKKKQNKSQFAVRDSSHPRRKAT